MQTIREQSLYDDLVRLLGANSLRRDLEAQLSHDRQQRVTLNGLRQGAGKEVGINGGIERTVRADSDNRRHLVLVIGALDKLGGDFSIKDGHLEVHQDTVELNFAACSQYSFIAIAYKHAAATKTSEKDLLNLLGDDVVLG